MSVFRRDRGGPDRTTVQEPAARTGRGDAVDSGGAAELLDAREPHEWRAGPAPRDVRLPLSAPAAGAGLPAEARARPPAVLRRCGDRSRRAAEPLLTRVPTGGAQAVDVIGGMEDRAGAGLPVVDARGGNGTVA